ncbi:hypothetical protein NQ317_013441 [Molorchus minor]|uniref:Uncharacterized protein n=1 Tax=Molorchus minor TaxID=1323400 RepID=A0ABQ9IRU4_9CUCU|nr:hypothetical protein NQ317_013441 [Molorchus minor]
MDNLDDFVDCLNPLKKITPLPKRCFNEIDDRVNKKEKHSEDELQILWSYDLKACVDCSPLVYKRVSETYIAIGRETVFKKNFPDNIESTPVLSPCVNYLLIGCYNGIMYCVDLSTNDIAWNYKTDNKIKSSGGFL